MANTGVVTIESINYRYKPAMLTQTRLSTESQC